MENNQLLNRKKVEIIAEIANAHQGDPENAYKLALEGINAGADAIKFQIYFAEELLTKKHKRYNHFKNQSFSPNIWINLISELKKNKVKIYCDIFGEKAFKIANRLNVDGFKLHSSDLNNIFLLDKLKRTNKKIFLSAGGSTINEIGYAINKLKKKEKLPVLLHGFQSYPTKVEDCELSRIKLFKEIFNNHCELGYQDHISTDDPLNFVIPQVAITLGARYIEKHITLNRSKKGIDYYSSLEPKEFKKFIFQIRNSDSELFKNKLHKYKSKIKNAIGNKPFNIKKAENEYRNQVKKIWFSRNFIKKNSIIKKKDLIMKRPAISDINTVFAEEIIGKKVLKNIYPETPIIMKNLKNKVAAIIVVRNNSKRLPYKALKKICGLHTIEHLINRVKRSEKIDEVILCTTRLKEDKIFKKIAKKWRINFFQGENRNVLSRMLGAISNKKTNLVVRITGDDILIDSYFLDKTIDLHLEKNLNYSENRSLPRGTEVEIFDTNLLKKIYYLAQDSSGSEYLTFYIDKYKDQFNTLSLPVKKKFNKQIRLTLDTQKDFQIIEKFLKKMKKEKKLFNYSMNDIFNFYSKNKNIFVARKIKTKITTKVNTNFLWKKILN
jgi:N,N'-diacetyllegionaminate synthase